MVENISEKTDKVILRDLTPQKIQDAAAMLAELQRRPNSNDSMEDLIAAAINNNLPIMKDYFFRSTPMTTSYGIRVRVLDMANELWKGDGVNHTGPKEIDVRFRRFHRGNPEDLAAQNPDLWYLEVSDPVSWWGWHIRVEDVQKIGHWRNPLPA